MSGETQTLKLKTDTLRFGDTKMGREKMVFKNIVDRLRFSLLGVSEGRNVPVRREIRNKIKNK